MWSEQAVDWEPGGLGSSPALPLTSSVPSAKSLLLCGSQRGRHPLRDLPAVAWGASGFWVPAFSASTHLSLLNIGIPDKSHLKQDR